MKKILGLITIMLVVAIAPSYAQANLNGNSDKVIISKADLTPAIEYDIWLITNFN